jgi:hypothetical protein
LRGAVRNVDDARMDLPSLMPMFDNRLVDPWVVPAIAGVGLTIGGVWIWRTLPRDEQPRSFRATATRTSVLPYVAVGTLIGIGVVLAASWLGLTIRR